MIVSWSLWFACRLTTFCLWVSIAMSCSGSFLFYLRGEYQQCPLELTPCLVYLLSPWISLQILLRVMMLLKIWRSSMTGYAAIFWCLIFRAYILQIICYIVVCNLIQKGLIHYDQSEYYSCDATYRNWLKIDMENAEVAPHELSGEEKQRAVVAAKRNIRFITAAVTKWVAIRPIPLWWKLVDRLLTDFVLLFLSFYCLIWLRVLCMS